MNRHVKSVAALALLNLSMNLLSAAAAAQKVKLPAKGTLPIPLMGKFPLMRRLPIPGMGKIPMSLMGNNPMALMGKNPTVYGKESMVDGKQSRCLDDAPEQCRKPKRRQYLQILHFPPGRLQWSGLAAVSERCHSRSTDPVPDQFAASNGQPEHPNTFHQPDQLRCYRRHGLLEPHHSAERVLSLGNAGHRKRGRLARPLFLCQVKPSGQELLPMEATPLPLSSRESGDFIDSSRSWKHLSFLFSASVFSRNQ